MTTDQTIQKILKYIKENNDFLNNKDITVPLQVKKEALLKYLQINDAGFSNADLQKIFDELNRRGWVAAADETFIAFDPALLSF